MCEGVLRLLPQASRAHANALFQRIITDGDLEVFGWVETLSSPMSGTREKTIALESLCDTVGLVYLDAEKTNAVKELNIALLTNAALSSGVHSDYIDRLSRLADPESALEY